MTDIKPTPSSPVSAPSPAGGVREAIARIIDPHSFVPYETTGTADDAVFADMVKSSLEDAYRKADRILALSSLATPEPDFPKPGRRVGKEPCGECHIKPDETCDICGARHATPEPASAPANGEVLVERVAEAILAEDWKGRFHPNVQPAVEEMHRDFARAAIAALNPAPGHGEGGL